MRLSATNRAAILSACGPRTRPNPKLYRFGGGVAVIWYDPEARPAIRWRGQLVRSVERDGTVWWSGEEHQHRTRAAVARALVQESHEWNDRPARNPATT